MTNNDILRSIRYTFNLKDSKMVELFALAGKKASLELVGNYLKKDEDPDFVKCSDPVLATFLNGLITEKRGKKDGPMPEPEKRLTNNIVLRKLKIALNYKDEDILDVMELAGLPIGKSELGAFFRKPSHKHYRECKDQFLRNFLKGIQIKYRPSK